MARPSMVCIPSRAVRIICKPRMALGVSAPNGWSVRSRSSEAATLRNDTEPLVDEIFARMYGTARHTDMASNPVDDVTDLHTSLLTRTYEYTRMRRLSRCTLRARPPRPICAYVYKVVRMYFRVGM